MLTTVVGSGKRDVWEKRVDELQSNCWKPFTYAVRVSEV